VTTLYKSSRRVIEDSFKWLWSTTEEVHESR